MCAVLCTKVTKVVSFMHLCSNNLQESWKVALKNKFKNNRKKAVNVSTEMQAVRAWSYRKSPRESQW